MKNRLVPSLLAATAAVCVLGFAAGPALAQHNIKASLAVPAGLTPDDLHIIFTGTGGTITAPSATPGAPGNPNVTGVGGAGNQVDVTWTAKLAAATPVEISFTCQHAPIGVLNGTWTNGGSVIGSVTAGDVTVVVDPLDPAPAASPLVMLLIALAIAGAGIMMLRRRATA